MADTVRTMPALVALLSDGAAAHSTNRQLLRDWLISVPSHVGILNAMEPRFSGGMKFDGTTDDTAAAQAVFDAVPSTGGSVFFPAFSDTSFANITGNLTIKARTKIFSNGRALLKGSGGTVWTVSAQGALAGTATTITATIARGDKNIAVTSTTGFTVGDAIELTGSTGATSEAQNSVNGPQRELNEVDTVTDGTHLRLKYPAAHDYAFDGSYTTQGGVAKVTAKDDIAIEGVDFDALSIIHGYNRGFRLKDVRLTRQGGLASTSTSSLYADIRNVEISNAIAGAGGNANAFVYGLRFSDVEIKSFGGLSDGIRFFGCADGTYRAKVVESVARGIYLYKCQSFSTPNSEVVGTQVTGITNEALLFNYCYDCDFTGLLDERLKLSSIVEFRGDSRNCRVINPTVHCAFTYAITWKTSSKDCKVIGGTWYSWYNGSAGYLVDLQVQTGWTWPDLLIDGPKLISRGPNTGFGVMRSASTTQVDVAAESAITIRNVEYDRGASNLLGLTGTALGEKINRLTVENCHSTNDDSANGALIVSQVPVVQFRINHLTLKPGTTRKIQLITGAVDNLYVYNTVAATLEVGSNVAALYYGNNAMTTYTIPDVSVVKEGILKGTSVLDFASIAAGAVGVMTITVTGVAAGDYVTLFPPAALAAGLVFSGYVSAANTITIRLFNGTASPIDPANATWGWMIHRRA